MDDAVPLSTFGEETFGGGRAYNHYSKDPHYLLKEVAPGVRRWVRRQGGVEAVVNEGSGQFKFNNQEEAAEFAAHLIREAAKPGSDPFEIDSLLQEMERGGWIDVRADETLEVLRRVFSKPEAVADGLVSNVPTVRSYVTRAAEDKLVDTNFVRDVYKSAAERYATDFPPLGDDTYRTGDFKKPAGKLAPADTVHSSLLAAFYNPSMEQRKVADNAYYSLLIDEDQGGLISARTREDRKRSWSESEAPANVVMGEVGAPTWETAKEHLVDDPALFQEVVEKAVEKGFDGRLVNAPLLTHIFFSDGVSPAGHDSPPPISREEWKVAREKTLDLAQKMHESPVMVINRTPSDVYLIEKFYKGEYPIMGADAQAGSHLDRIYAENGAGLGRVVYGALGFDGILNYRHTGFPFHVLNSEMVRWANDDDWNGSLQEIDYETRAALASLHNRNMVDLGNTTWGNVQTVWVPPELKEGGISYSMGDSFVMPQYGDDKLPYGMLGRAAEMVAASAFSYPDNPTDFIELHLDRPMRVEDELRRIIYRANDDYLPRGFWQRGEPAAPPMFGEVAAAINTEGLERLFPWADRAGVPVEIFIPTLHPLVTEKADEYADELDDFIKGKTGGMATVIRPWEEK